MESYPRVSQLWSTSQFATNDSAEMMYGYGVLSNILNSRNTANNMAEEPYGKFEECFSIGMDHFITAYITSFRRARDEEEYHNGLLNHWRSYGGVDGYAIEFSQTELENWARKVSRDWTYYELQDVYYDKCNPLREGLKDLADDLSGMFHSFNRFLQAYNDDERAGDLAMQKVRRCFDVRRVTEAYLRYLANTKHPEFNEESEVRLGVYTARQLREQPPECFVRKRSLVPYVKSAKCGTKELLNAISGIVIGPGHDHSAAKGLQHYLLELGRSDVNVRRSSYRYPA